MALPFEVTPFEMPSSVDDIRASRIGMRILDLHSMIEPDFRLTDTDIKDVLYIMDGMDFLIAHSPDYPEDVYGFGAFTQYADYPDHISIPYLGVHMTARGNGIGRTLLRTIEHIAVESQQKGLVLSMLDSVQMRQYDPGYVSPQQFYENYGFELTDPEHRIMQLALPR